MKPRVFIGSSVEGLNIAYAIQENLQHQAEVTVWDQGVFQLSSTTIESLISILENSDIGIFVFSPDDEVIMRGEGELAIRDNVLFELGLFIGNLGRERSFFIIPENTEFRLPTDLLGITPGTYETGRSDSSYQAATGVFCNQIREQLKRLGPINGSLSDPSENPSRAKDNPKNNSTQWIQDLVKKEYDSGIEKIKKEIKTEKDKDIIINLESWISYALYHKATNNKIKTFIDLIAKYPDSPTPYIRYLQTLLWSDNFTSIQEISDEALKKFPENNSLKILKGEHFVKLGKPDEALSFYDSLSKGKNDIPPEILLEYYDILINTDQKDKAHEHIHKCFLLHPDNESILFKYYKLADELSLNSIALFLIDKLTSLNSENHTYWTYKGNACLNLEMYDRSLFSYEKGKDLSPKKESWILGNIGNILKHKGFYSKSITYFKKAIKIDPESEYSLKNLASAISLKTTDKKQYDNEVKKGRKLIFELAFDAEQSTD